MGDGAKVSLKVGLGADLGTKGFIESREFGASQVRHQFFFVFLKILYVKICIYLFTSFHIGLVSLQVD